MHAGRQLPIPEVNDLERKVTIPPGVLSLALSLLLLVLLLLPEGRLRVEQLLDTRLRFLAGFLGASAGQRLRRLAKGVHRSEHVLEGAAHAAPAFRVQLWTPVARIS